MVAANRAVRPPMTPTVVMAVGDKSKMAWFRTTMYTPAVTIVAAWMSALTGVGPAIASGSHTYSGICADFPIAPTKRQMHASMIATLIGQSLKGLPGRAAAVWRRSRLLLNAGSLCPLV